MASANSNITLQIQMFLDEWQYAVIHSGVASAWDREQVIEMALRLLETHGVPFAQGETAQMCLLEESVLCQQIEERMSKQCRDTFEHFALQLQLIVSTATRVRRGLEDNSEEATSAFDTEDVSGIAMQIMKQSIVEAGFEAAELRKRHDSWGKSTDARLQRLALCAEESQYAAQQLAVIESQMSQFGGNQNSKSKKVLMGVAANQDKALKQSVFASWNGYFIKFKSEKAIHDKFKTQIENAERKLLEYRQHQLNNVRNVLMRKASEGDEGLMCLIIEAWKKDMEESKSEGTNAAMLKQAQAKLAGYKSSQADNTKKVMMRMNAGNDSSLVSLVWQNWCQFIAEYRKDKEFEDQVKHAERELQSFLQKKSEEARGVLDRMSSGSDAGLLKSILSNWIQFHIEDKKGREMEELVASGGAKLGSLNQKQRGAANGRVTRTNRQVELNTMAIIFDNWTLDLRVHEVMKYYQSKLDGKKHQLQTVQHMFQKFAQTLEKGITETPRSDAKYTKQKSHKEAPVSLPPISQTNPIA